VLVGTGAKLAVIEELRTYLDTDFGRAVEFLHGTDLYFHDVDDGAIQDSKAEMRRTGQAVTRRDFLSCHTFDVRERLEEIDTPTLAIVGEHDRLTPVAYHEYFADHIPDCDLAVVEDAAHLVMIERPVAFNNRLGSFVSGL
jgi:pimeloyl-ACP methyl ester carboxylesterase